MQKWEKVSGSQINMPEEFDTTSSKVYVYQRRNIKKVEILNGDGTVTELWEYEERKLTHDEYSILSEIISNRHAITVIENALCELDAAKS